MLTVENLRGGYGKSQVLFDISFEVKAGEAVCLMGRNGMGKTTTVRTLMGMLPATGGRASFDGIDILAQPTTRIARAGIGLVPEGRQIFPNLTVEENLIVASRAANADPWTVDKIFTFFPGLHERRGSAGSLLSGGEQQMLAIGRALMTNPKLLILDEATEGLAPVIRDQIWDCLVRLRGLGQSIVVIDKHLKRLTSFVDTFHVIDKGRVVWSGDAHRVADEEASVKALISM
jgi:branched-chain amino acid transport system ATP-binding protein